jgi:alpha 1,2-mannosyltransferase
MELFEGAEYKQSGSVFWSDLNKDHRESSYNKRVFLQSSQLILSADNAIFRVMGRDCTDDHWPGEAGQLVFDKRANNGLNLAVLHLTNHMMEEDKMYGFLSYGDKDTFVSPSPISSQQQRHKLIFSASPSTPSD